MKNPRFDAYIAKAAPFAQPVLKKLRALFHTACPDIEEHIKWGHLSFEHKGMVAGVAAFKAHLGVNFWRQKQLSDPKGIFSGNGAFGMGRITGVSDLPAEAVLMATIREAVALNEAGAPSAMARPQRPRAALEVPEPFMAALRRNKKALAAFEAFPPSHKREYVEWIREAKKEETVQRRIATAVEWIAQGKPRNWQYM